MFQTKTMNVPVAPAEGAAEAARTLVQRHARVSRNLILPLAVLLLAASLTMVALRQTATKALDAQLDVVSVEDPFHLGATTRARVTLKNQGSKTIHPRFSVSSLSYPHFWKTSSGPLELRAHLQADYVIDAPDATAAPRDGATFQIRVNDAQSIVYVIADSITLEQPRLSIVNPDLRFWTQRDAATGHYVPAGWSSFQFKGTGDNASIEEATSPGGVAAAHLSMRQDGKDDEGNWAHTGLTQSVGFPREPIRVGVMSRAPYRAASGLWPLNAFGLEVSDGTNGLLWLLFQPTGHGDLDYDLPTGHHIHVYDVPPGEWLNVPIDLQSIYAQLGRAMPEQIGLKIFIAAASTGPDQVDGFITGIRTDAPAVASAHGSSER